jgi:hypothetical protein
MIPKEPDSIDALPDRLQDPLPRANTPAPGNGPGLGVDWGSNIDPGPGPDPRVIQPDGRTPGRSMAA